jgi:UDP-glucose 4-epimerase
MKVALIGGAGFIGMNLYRTLAAQGHEVHVFDRPQSLRCCLPQKNVTFFAGNFFEPDDLSSAMRDCEVVFHLVSTTIPKTSNDNPVADVNENVIGSLHLLNEAIKCGVRRIIFISSGGTVYGKPQYTPIDENHPTDPICSYGITKLMVEKYLALYQELHGLEYLILRLSNPFGEFQRPSASQGAIAVFLGKLLRDEIIEIWGDGNITRDYLYIGDIMDALLAALEYEGQEKLFNIGSGQGRTLLDILAAIENMVGHPPQHRFLPRRSFDVPINILSIHRAFIELHWSPKTVFHDGIMRTFRWLESQDTGKHNL